MINQIGTTFSVFNALPPFNSLLSDRATRLIGLGICQPSEKFVNFFQSLAQRSLPKAGMDLGRGLRIDMRAEVVNACAEELLFRLFIQTILLKELPKNVLKIFGVTAERAEELVNHRMAKISRVLVTALLFMAAHAGKFGNARGMLVHQLLGGLAWGALKESGTPLVQVAFLHFSYNAFAHVASASAR